ncbi:MAG: NUDIX domain-containing protein [Bacteroidales bacterium]|nr:NUDIX domain-containing protein [Bacteroidales bacterium]
MKSITVYFNNQKIILWKKTEELEIKVDSLEIDEPFLHKCNNRMSNILNTFFERKISEISFEHYDFNKLFNDFKSHFKYIEAAGGIVTNENKELLVIHRFEIPDLPKGKIEEGETPEDAAIREVKEECGINNIRITEEVQSSYHIYTCKNKRILKKTYWFKMQHLGNQMPVPQTAEDITKVEWCNILKVKEHKQHTYSSLKVYFEK